MLRRAPSVVALLLVVIAACAFVYPWDDQDGSRLSLTQGIGSYGTLRIDRWQNGLLDKSFYNGHWYSDKAPGLSFFALPTYEVVHGLGGWNHSWTLWLMRVLTGGVFFVLLLFAMRLAADRVAPGSGTVTAIATGAGTFAFSLAPTTFSHLPAGTCGLIAFLLLTEAVRDERRGPLLTAAAGLAAGTAVLFDYLAGIIVIVLAGYVLATTRSPRRLLAYVAGGLPAAVVLAIYDQLAFGAPWKLSYRYVTGYYGQMQGRGIFGSGIPKLGYLEQIFGDSRGILITSPILVVAFVGLVVMWRRERRADVGACLAIVTLFFVYVAGYFDPIGGTSPGPRFLGAALPFAMLGLAPLIQARPRLVLLLVGCSVATSIVDAVQWAWKGAPVDWLFVTMPPAVAGVITAAILAPALAVAAAPWLAEPAPASRRRAG